MPAPPSSYEFGRVRVEPAELRVYRDSEQVYLEPKAFQVLLYLLAHAGHLVGKDDILQSVWQGSFVTENALTRLVAQLRRVLGDSAHEPRYIETVPTVGYRLIADVTATGELVDQLSPKSRTTLAVLPFRMIGSDLESYLGFGIADSLIAKLSGTRQLAVRPASSVIRYHYSDTEAIVAGRELKVATVLEGSLHKIDDRLRVSVQLVDVDTESNLWADTFTADFGDIFDVQDEISFRIADSLELRLSTGERNRIARRPTENLDAFKLCLRARYHLHGFQPDDFAKACELYEQAVELDPNYALAHAGLANAYGLVAKYGDEPAAERAESLARRAIYIDPGLSEAHASLAALQFWSKRETSKAEGSFERALELDPNCITAQHYYSWYLTARGEFGKAKRHVQRALELDPLSMSITVDQGLPFFFDRKYAEAARRYQYALDTDNTFFYGWLRYGEAMEGLERHHEARKSFKKALSLSRGDPAIKACLARSTALSGDASGSRALISEITDSADTKMLSDFYLALAYLASNDRRAAFRCLRRACERRDKWFGWVVVDPRLDPLRDDPDLDKLIQGAFGKAS